MKAVVGEEALSAEDKLALEFLDKFERQFVGQSMHSLMTYRNADHTTQVLMSRGQSSILWISHGVCCASSLKSSSTVSAPRLLKSSMGARQPVNIRQRRSARHERVVSLKISWWMTHDRCGVYAFHVRDWRGWPGIRTLTSGSCLSLGEVL
jgi:hypothetical protein